MVPLEGVMTRLGLTVLVALAAGAATACDRFNPVAPTSATSVPTVSGGVVPIATSALMGSWQATKAAAWRAAPGQGGFVEVPGSRRDLVAEGGTITLRLEPNSQPLGRGVPPGRYTVTIVMPGHDRGIDTGFWYFGPAWQPQNQGLHQIDFYPDSLGPNRAYGDIPAFLVALSDDQRTLKLWDSGLSFLPYDFGWLPGETVLELEFARQ